MLHFNTPVSSLSHINFAETASDEVDSPRSDKLVDVCKNCNYSFRPGTRSSDGFCSKDCQTCYTLFYKGAQTPTTPKDTRNALEIKQAIYQFQCKLDEEDSSSKKTRRQEIPFSPVKNNTITIAIENKQDDTQFVVRGNWTSRLFTSPKPKRPHF